MPADEKKWEQEANVRTIKDYFELKSNPDAFKKAMEQLEKETNSISEELKKDREHKEKVGFTKK